MDVSNSPQLMELSLEKDPKPENQLDMEELELKKEELNLEVTNSSSNLDQEDDGTFAPNYDLSPDH